MASSTPTSDKTTATSVKLRSCVICRSRKVRCDKLSPCSNCRRANIPCVLPSTDRPPRWARRLERSGNSAAESNGAKPGQEVNSKGDPIIERLHNLENLVKELRGQLEHANATAGHSNDDGLLGLGGSDSSPLDLNHDSNSFKDNVSVENTSDVQKKFGRLVLKDVNRSRYISSGFWARMNDEIEGLQMETRGAIDADSDIFSNNEDVPERTASTLEHERTPSERHGFLFKHNINLSDSDLFKLRPLPSQIPFLLNVYCENIHVFMRIVDIPAITDMIRELRGNKGKELTPTNEALMFSIYYATVTSMEEDEVISNFGCTKSELSFKYRLGLENSLAKADFLSEPDITLVKALLIFLFLVRRHESPRFVWMMTGLVIRMAQALGLHRDGSHFPNLTPYEIETRRRVWWTVCLLDLRASEDQGTELSTTGNSVDTKFPLNINDVDLNPHTQNMPPARSSVTDMTLTVVSAEMCDVMRRLMASSIGESPSSPEIQSRLLHELYGTVDKHFLQFNMGSKTIASWCLSTLTRMVVSKMNLILNLPVLFSSPSEKHSEKVRTKLLISAIEVAEYNHALNSEKDCQNWNWLFQTCTHWHAIVYLLIETSRRQWSPIIERAWVALHSKWLIPRQLTNTSERDENSRIWVPLRKLMAKTRKHRVAELQRLRENSWSAIELEREDEKIPLPTSPVPSYDGKSDNVFRERWRKLVAIPLEMEDQRRPSGMHTPESTASDPPTTQRRLDSTSVYEHNDSSSNLNTNDSNFSGQKSSNLDDQSVYPRSQTGIEQSSYLSQDGVNPVSSEWYRHSPGVKANDMSPTWSEIDPSAGIFTEVDVNMELDMDVNWYEWIESAQVMDLPL
ncbi:putative fungal specific transcription factor domain-containing protein [Botrytis fragariae]|uniref:Putative fungal specific transcription factor domain-containing protein n=1 Tax=Botrytis fragariae TaxID=1964551 RepID=A0A8H6EGP8_9HELO|nr:putative fungal specific transcription factor domain-containing protein [Botrytis fragariae]KAF5871563.1 putative fungal specific transcription factor domain-containing protein [Botrytis fragariae]